MLIRDDNADMRLSINGKEYFDSWATYEGGGLTATDAKTRQGGMGPELSAGGPRTRGNVVMTIQFDDVVAGFHDEIEATVGSGVALPSVQYLNPDKSPIPGARFTRKGTVIGAEVGKSDSMGTAILYYTVTISCQEAAVAG